MLNKFCNKKNGKQLFDESRPDNLCSYLLRSTNDEQNLNIPIWPLFGGNRKNGKLTLQGV